LPAPLGPVKNTNSPRSTCRETSFNACDPPRVQFRCSRWTIRRRFYAKHSRFGSAPFGGITRRRGTAFSSALSRGRRGRIGEWIGEVGSKGGGVWGAVDVEISTGRTRKKWFGPLLARNIAYSMPHKMRSGSPTERKNLPF